MRAVSILFLLFSCHAAAQTACGPSGVSFKVTVDKSQRALPPPEPGKARVYAIGSGTIAMDGQWMGEGSRDTYFSFSVEPGLHHLCSRRRTGV